jgi:hypothetical protein
MKVDNKNLVFFNFFVYNSANQGLIKLLSFNNGIHK